MQEKSKRLARIRLSRADLWLFGGILSAAILLWLGLTIFAPRGAEAVVTAGGRVVLRLPLDRDCTATVETAFGTHTVVVEDGTVRVAAAPCPNQICVAHAPIAHNGETVVCLPCGVVVTVTDGNGDVILQGGTAAETGDVPGEMSP